VAFAPQGEDFAPVAAVNHRTHYSGRRSLSLRARAHSVSPGVLSRVSVDAGTPLSDAFRRSGDAANGLGPAVHGVAIVERDKLPMAAARSGREAAEAGVARARDAYERFAEAGEMALNAFETAMAQGFDGWRSVMGSSRDTAHQLAESNVAGARNLREQWEAAGARLYNAYEDHAGHTLAAMREIGHRMLVASDTNVRASLDFAERLAKAADAREVAALHVGYFQDQARRLTEQMVDLHQTTSRLAREAAARSEAP
jgi:hypothetical protein